MGIPSDFSDTGLTGFNVSSTKLVKIEQQYKGVKGKKFISPGGGKFVRIDDPGAVDSNGLRTTDASNTSISLETGNTWLPRLHADGTLTCGGKCAWLECTNVTIPKNKRLWFRYAFLRFSSLPADSFSVLLCFPNDDTSVPPLPPYWICSVKELQENRGNINQTDWTECFVEIDKNADFHGTLRWVVATGHNLADQNSIPDNTRFTRPGCLLIDAIDIR